MNAIVNIHQADLILRRAISEVRESSWQPTNGNSSDIRDVILGSHLTYRYILITGLLAKATNEQVNPIALQAGSSLEGAYDARSLCHKVIIPIERELLASRLGGSNEPFLNKPARYTELSTSNAVRRGKDTQTLAKNILILSGVASSQDAYLALKDTIYFILQRPSRDLPRYFAKETTQTTTSSLVAFAQTFISISHEGETTALLAGAAFDMLATRTGENLKVIVHKVNQAGSSSNEISDVDVYDEDGILQYTSEVKDKPFSKEDVDHAVTKMLSNRHSSLIFLKGSKAKLINATEQALILEWGAKGVSIHFISVIEFFTSIVSLSPKLTPELLINTINKHASAANVKDATRKHLAACLLEQGW